MKKNTIRAVLFGGLGNQMFQYAAARALSIRFNRALVIDLSWFLFGTKNTTPRVFELDRLALSGSLTVQSSHLRGFYLHFLFPRLKNTVAGKWIARWLHLYQDADAMIYDDRFCRLQPPVLLWGYFQSEKYFENIRDCIRSDFRFKQPLAGRNREIAEQIGRSPSVAIHIRRGDYLSNRYARQVFAVCSLAYYRRAIHYISGRVAAPQFYVFSDEPEWAGAHLPIPGAVYVDWNTGTNSFIDMQLMSLCDHQILANSSFSWWGAWLNPREDKIVIAPAVWLKSASGVHDLLPADWALMPDSPTGEN
jgi:hypothetical protein